MRAFGVVAFFLLFLFFARWYFVCGIMNECNPEGKIIRPQTLMVVDTGTQIMKGFQEFGFTSDGVTPMLSSDNQHFLDSLTEYLLRSPSTELLIHAYLFENELGIPSGRFENKGLARADGIRQLLAERGIPEQKVFLDYFVAESEILRHPVHFQVAEPEQWDRLHHPVRYTMMEMCYSAVALFKGSDSLVPGKAVRAYVSELNSLLAKRPIEALEILGYSSSGENKKASTRQSENLARMARQQLVELNVNLPMNVLGLGDREPLVPANAPLAAEKNDRVIFRLVPKTR